VCQSGAVTNDLVELINENKFFWLGRYDHIVNSGGVKLIPEVIEDKLKSVITESFIITGIPDEKLGEALTLVIESEELPEYIQERLDGVKSLDKYERPNRIVHLKSFPLTKNGKIRRSQLREQVISSITSA
ncbi:MAG: O-succinylbenzoic acid--CoA ligase, partial [Eudoraea sp.]|nr:O-succinylbenzoic acid--CoA ligase [Eudoraea sp.]